MLSAQTLDPVKKIDVFAVPVDSGILNATSPALIAQWLHDIQQFKPDLIIFTPLILRPDKNIDTQKFQEQLVGDIQQQLQKNDIRTPCIPKGFLLADSSGLLSCYSQPHHIAVQFPHARIRYTAHANNPATLSALVKFYSESNNLFLVPRSVSMRFRPYCNGRVFRACAAQGKGRIDFAYPISALEMVKCAGINLEEIKNSYTQHNICAALSGEANFHRLANFQNFVKEANAPYYYLPKDAYAKSSRLFKQPSLKLNTIPEEDEESICHLTEKITSSPSS